MNLAPWRRHLVLACFCAGLTLSPLQALPAGSGAVLAVAAALLVIAGVRLGAPAAAPWPPPVACSLC